MTSLILFDAVTEGHRGAYLRTLQRELGGEILVGVSTRAFRRLLASDASLFTTAETALRFATAVTVVRALLGRRTVLISLRAHLALADPSPRGWCKRTTWRLLRSCPSVTVVSIVPAAALPEVLRVTNATIFDPQLWDLSTDDGAAEPLGIYARRVQALAAGRSLVVSLGGQSDAKGVRFFCDIWRASAAVRERFLFVSGGAVDADLTADVAEFARLGGLVDNRFLSDGELLDLYRSASLIWSCYHPGYDQASGVFGRAAQFGVPTVVRKSSLARFQSLWGKGLAIAYDDPTAAAEALLAYDDFAREKRLDVDATRAELVAVLKAGLFAKSSDGKRRSRRSSHDLRPTA